MKYHTCYANDEQHGYLFLDEVEICPHCKKEIEK